MECVAFVGEWLAIYPHAGRAFGESHEIFHCLRLISPEEPDRDPAQLLAITRLDIEKHLVRDEHGSCFDQ